MVLAEMTGKGLHFVAVQVRQRPAVYAADVQVALRAGAVLVAGGFPAFVGGVAPQAACLTQP